MMASALAVMFAVLALSRVNTFGFAAASLVVISFGLSLIFGLSNTIVQERAPSHLRGRVSAVMGLSFFGLMPALFILSRIGGRLNETPTAITNSPTPEVAAAL